ncbi:MAG TPA: hypothetical protein ENI68_09760 [Gammaproteobacteria bacterium]|nr:hypothetical protein [Gammaproteobacteria bacterium]
MNFNLLAVTPRRLFVLACITALTACGGGSSNVSDSQNVSAAGGGSSNVSDSQNVSAAGGETYQITGAGIKGPLAYAMVSIHALDTNFNGLYDPDRPIATATTNAYAEITGLSVSKNAPPESAPPYILVVDGTNAIDRNTNMVPVIKKLVTVITRESLAAGQPVYATPYTTLAYQMLRLDTPWTENAARGTVPLLTTRLSSFSEEIIGELGFHIPTEIDIFTTPPIITKETASTDQQLLVVYYRSAIEAISSILNKMSLATDSRLSTDTLIRHLALDLYRDGVVNGATNGVPITGINIDILNQDPMLLDIPNTQYLVSDIYGLLYEERALVGASTNVPFLITDTGFVLDAIAVNGVSASPPQSSPSDTVVVPRGDTLADNTPVDYLLQTDFNNRPIGAYAESEIKVDFHWNENGWNDTNALFQHMSLVNDPLNDGHGVVLAVKRLAGQGWQGPGSGGMAFKADFPEQEDIYLAYDMYIPSGNELMKIMKFPGLMFGTGDMVGHPDFNTYPTPDSLQTFVFTPSSDGNGAWGRGDGALNLYYYDKERISGNEFFDRTDPTFTVGENTSQGGDQYNQPKGYWITIEMRMKMNTVTQEGVSGLRDGLSEIWITDPNLNGGVAKLVSQRNHKWRVSNNIKIDGIGMSLSYGGNGDDPENQPSNDQYHYFDNFRVSTTPITH